MFWYFLRFNELLCKPISAWRRQKFAFWIYVLTLLKWKKLWLTWGDEWKTMQEFLKPEPYSDKYKCQKRIVSSGIQTQALAQTINIVSTQNHQPLSNQAILFEGLNKISHLTKSCDRYVAIAKTPHWSESKKGPWAGILVDSWTTRAYILPKVKRLFKISTLVHGAWGSSPISDKSYVHAASLPTLAIWHASNICLEHYLCVYVQGENILQ